MLPRTPPITPPPTNLVLDYRSNTDLWDGTAFEDILIDFVRWTFIYTVDQLDSGWHWLRCIFEILFNRLACDQCKIEKIAEIIVANKEGICIEQAHNKAIELLDINEELWRKLVNRPGNHPGVREIFFRCILDIHFFEKGFSERFQLLRKAVRSRYPELLTG